MANTRFVDYIANFRSGIKIPTGAGANKLLTSDAEGVASWATREKDKFVEERPWTWVGELPTGEITLPGFFVKVGGTNEKKLLAVEFKIESGTEVEFELRRIKEEEASAAITGYTALKAKSNKVERKEESTTLSSKDFIYVKLIKSSGTAKNLSITAFVEVIVS